MQAGLSGSGARELRALPAAPGPAGPVIAAAWNGPQMAPARPGAADFEAVRRIVLVDDHRLLREGVRRALEDAGMVVVGEASDGQEALRLVDRLRPDLVIMDVSMPVLDGIATTRVLVQRHPGLAIIMLTMFTDPATLARVREVGAIGWLGKDCSSEQIIEAVEAAVAGASFESWDRGPSGAPPARPAHGLTARECEVLTLVAEGASTAQLAARLYISPRTVKNHLASIYAKLDARDRTQALVQAAKLGIVDLH